MIKEYKGDHYFLSPKFFSRFVLYDETFENVNDAYDYCLKEVYEEGGETIPEHFLYQATLEKFNQNLFLQGKLLNINLDEFNRDEEYGNILFLVHSTIARKKAVDDLIKEQNEMFDWEFVE